MTTKIRSAVALVCAAFVLSSCGFNAAIERENTITNGGFDLDSSLKVLAARVVSAGQGGGVLIGNLANSETTTDNAAVTVTSIAGDGITADGFKPITVEPGDSVNLTHDPIALTGESIYPGSVVHLTYTFSDGTSARVPAVVVLPCFEYADIKVPDAASVTCARGGASLPEHESGESEH